MSDFIEDLQVLFKKHNIFITNFTKEEHGNNLTTSKIDGNNLTISKIEIDYHRPINLDKYVEQGKIRGYIPKLHTRNSNQ